MKTYILIIVLILSVLSTAVMADVPPLISYQGKLMQPNGTPIPDGTYSIRFAIYSVPADGDMLWSETISNVQVKGGLFAVLLGSVNNLGANILDSEARYLGIKVGNDDELIPRQRIASVATSLRAGEADIAKTVPDGAITTVKLADGAVTTSNLADSSVSTSKVADSGITTPKIADSSVTTGKLALGSVSYNRLPSGTVINRWYQPWFGVAGDAMFSTNSKAYVSFGKVLQNGGLQQRPDLLPGLSRRFRLLVSESNDQTSGHVYVRVKSADGVVRCEYKIPLRWANASFINSGYSSTFQTDNIDHWYLEARVENGTMYIHGVQLVVEDYVP